MTTRPPRPELEDRDPNADLEHANETRVGDGTYADGGDCLTCGVMWPCPTEVRRQEVDR